ncbi:MarR family winged helix-turn-helix transcriptional regulator [Rhodovulum sulfidophilum]|uniref:MarR family winged helix-turn-helix transcriptional regulator n=1 Tax=Rhodovulum sulfidophilum TaxID=35806 RepID=UPI001923368D|nr:MarR family transcriptional regulator [Rhodovulum sulfidophilum]MBL3562394.1 winged helix DNA-binding protein [Rhodovulum sulfidophilum]
MSKTPETNTDSEPGRELGGVDMFEDLGRLLPAVGQSWRRLLAQRLSKEGLSDAAALPILVLLRARKGASRQNFLAHQLGLETSGVVRLLDALSKRGLLRRTEDPTDRRAKLVELTDEGIAMGERADRIARALRYELLAELDRQDLIATIRILRSLSAVLDASEERQKGR